MREHDIRSEMAVDHSAIAAKDAFADRLTTDTTDRTPFRHTAGSRENKVVKARDGCETSRRRCRKDAKGRLGRLEDVTAIFGFGGLGIEQAWRVRKTR